MGKENKDVSVSLISRYCQPPITKIQLQSPKRQPTIEELKSSCFHHEQKGCDLYSYGYYRQGDGIIEITEDTEPIRPLNRQKCRTHNATVCRAECGWEVGIHFGELSPGYNN